MTPRYPWRRRFVRETLVPILLTLAVSIIIGIALGASIAHAAPVTAGERYAQHHAADVCIALDTHPTIPGLITVLNRMDSDGLTPHESGVAVATSVLAVCPIHQDLLEQFVSRYSSSTGRIA